MTEGTERIRPMIVGVDVQDVWPRWRRSSSMELGLQREQESGDYKDAD